MGPVKPVFSRNGTSIPVQWDPYTRTVGPVYPYSGTSTVQWDQYSQPGTVSIARNDTDSGFSQHPFGTDFGKTDILVRLRVHRCVPAVGTGFGVVYPVVGWYPG